MRQEHARNSFESLHVWFGAGVACLGLRQTSRDALERISSIRALQDDYPSKLRLGAGPHGWRCPLQHGDDPLIGS